MNPTSLIQLLESFARIAESNSGEFLKFFKDRDGWNVETLKAISVRTSLAAAIDNANERWGEYYPDSEAAERAEYERLRLKFGGAPLPPPEPPGMWVGEEHNRYEDFVCVALFDSEEAAAKWRAAAGDRARIVTRVPFHTP